MGLRPEFLITGKRMDASGSRIVQVEVRQVKGDTVDPPAAWNRSAVVLSIRLGGMFFTATPGAHGEWVRHEEVHMVVVNGVYYIRTDRNAVRADNLGDLPDF